MNLDSILEAARKKTENLFSFSFVFGIIIFTDDLEDVISPTSTKAGDIFFLLTKVNYCDDPMPRATSSFLDHNLTGNYDPALFVLYFLHVEIETLSYALCVSMTI